MNKSKKIVLVGHFGVGKSSLIRRFVSNSFSNDYKVTIGVQILKREIEIDQKKITFIIWDIEGKEALQEIRPSYLLGTSAFIYVVDATRNATYLDFNNEIKYIKNNFPNIGLVSVANKSDLINEKDFRAEIAKQNLVIDFFTSAKSGENVDAIFEKLAINFLNE
ncbi:Rab family GTPase [Flavobacterium sp.]|uniref:Rab family GTPase n=1 Tax=Flavobacterium sp. TaxID=239 RepID=UPI00286B325B|nr:Rab family GTPase [Flavobacterium sp.]